jgi:tetratricopeptide (TPR) repeat protein
MRQNLLIGLLLALATIALYAPVRSHSFVEIDDHDYVVSNALVREGLSSEGIRWALTAYHASNWHPLTWLSHMIDSELFGPDDYGAIHLVNVALHAANALLLFLVLVRMTGARWASAFVAAAFAWHPLHVESVAWIAERKDVLSTFFGLLCLGAYAEYAERGRWSWYLLAVLALALGLMAKPMLVSLPFLLLLLDYWPLERFERERLGRLILEKLPLLALALASCVVTYLAQRASGSVALWVPLGARLGNALVGYVTYMGRLLWPTHLAVLYPFNQPWPIWQVLAAGGVLIAISAAVLALRRQRYLTVGWCWYLGTLVPVIGLVQVGHQSTADRYMYLPAIGLLIMLAWGARALCDRRGATAGMRAVAAAAGVCSLLACAVLTHRQLGYWANSEKLFKHTLDVTRDNWPIHSGMAVVMLSEYRGRQREAIYHCQRALGVKPDWPDAHNTCGTAFRELGRYDEAIAHYRKAIAARPRFAEAYTNLGQTLTILRRYDEAIDCLAKAVSIAPDIPEIRNSYGTALYEAGRYTEAIVQFRQAVRLMPDDAAMLTNLAWLLATHPDASERNGSEAVRLATRASQMTQGRWEGALDALAAALAETGRFDLAVDTARQAIAIRDRPDRRERLELYRAGKPFRIPGS